MAAHASRFRERPRQVPVDVPLEVVVGVELVRDPPVEHEHVEAGGGQVLDRAVARAQIEDVAPADEAVHDHDRRSVAAVAALVAPQLRLAALPHDVLRRRAERRPVGAPDVPDAVARSQDRPLDVTIEAPEQVARVERGRHPRIHPTPDRGPGSSISETSSESWLSRRSIRASCWRMLRMSDPAGRFSRCRHASRDPLGRPDHRAPNSGGLADDVEVRVGADCRLDRLTDRPFHPKHDAQPQRVVCWHAADATVDLN